MNVKNGGVATKVFLAVIVILVIALFAYNMQDSDNSPTDKAWNAAMTKGNPENKNHFIEYTDMFCPYCAKFNRALGDDFDKDYIETDKVFFELRLTSLIADHSVNSERGGETGYCAAKQDKFWPYYEEILGKLFRDYHSRGIGVSKTSPKIPELEDKYFLDAAEKVGLDTDKMDTCLQKGEALQELQTNTARAAQLLPSGVPFFILNDYHSSGFDGDYSTVKMMLKAGGVE